MTTMLKRLLGLLGWLGVALVFASVAIRNLRPEWGWWYGLAHRRPRLHRCSTCSASGARSRASSPAGRRATASLAGASILVVLGILARDQLPGRAPQQALGPDGGEQYTLSDQTKKVLQGLTKPVQGDGVRADRRLRALPQRLDEYQYRTKQLQVEYIDPGEAAVARREAEGERARNDRARVRRPRAARHVRRRAGPDQRR